MSPPMVEMMSLRELRLDGNHGITGERRVLDARKDTHLLAFVVYPASILSTPRSNIHQPVHSPTTRFLREESAAT